MTELSHDIQRLEITHDRDGSVITTTVQRLNRGDGPTLGVVALQHGDEWFAARMMFELAQRARDWDFEGTLALVPVASPPALRDLTRITQSDADEPDLNRIWTTERTWIGSQLARTLASEVIDHCDAVVDLHLGIWGSTFGGVCYAEDLPDPAVSQRNRELAFAYGADCVERLKLMGAFPGPRAVGGYAGTRGIPGITLELGGAGFDLEQEQRWIEDFLRGISNLMISLGMMAGEPQLPDRTLETAQTLILTPSHGGLMIPANEPEQLLRWVEAGEVLARIYSPQTFEMVEELKAPFDGWLFGMARSYVLRPGGWAFAIAPAEGAQWRDRSN